MLELRIFTGLHRGAALALEGDQIRIGSGDENDIVLLDPGMPVHAATLERSAASSWSCRVQGSAQQRGELPPGVPAKNHIEVVAGARWFAGPVLMGCEEESAPWCDAAAEPSRAPPDKPRFPMKAKLALAVVAAGLIAAVAASLDGQAPSRLGMREPAVRASGTLAGTPAGHAVRLTQGTTPAPAQASGVRVLTATVYPNDTRERPPFSIRSASGGPYGFIVTDDGQVLMPGSRWRAFTLVRIEPGRAVFTGPHAAELTW